MAPPIIMTPMNDFLGSLMGVPSSVLSFLNQILSTMKLWYIQFQQWSSGCVQVLYSLYAPNNGQVDTFGGGVANHNLISTNVSPAIFKPQATFRIKGFVRLTGNISGADAISIAILFNGSVIGAYNFTTPGSDAFEIIFTYNNAQAIQNAVMQNLVASPLTNQWTVNSVAAVVGTAPNFTLQAQYNTAAGHVANVIVYYYTIEVM